MLDISGPRSYGYSSIHRPLCREMPNRSPIGGFEFSDQVVDAVCDASGIHGVGLLVVLREKSLTGLLTIPKKRIRSCQSD